MPVIGVIRLILLLVVGLIVGFGLRSSGFDIDVSAIGGAGAAIVVVFALAFNDHVTGYDPGS